MKFSNIKDVYFDLDHTLWDFDKNSALTFEAIFKDEKIDIELQDFLGAYVPINSNYWELYRNDQISKEALRTGRLKDSFKLLKFKIPSKTLDVLSNKYIEFLPTFSHLLEDTLDILEYLRPSYQLHIITNGFQEVQTTKMVNSNIFNYFSTITTSEEVGVKKPHPHIFDRAMRKSKALPENSIMIGDNYAADIIGAKNAGLHTVYFDYYQKKEISESITIQKLKELRMYL